MPRLANRVNFAPLYPPRAKREAKRVLIKLQCRAKREAKESWSTYHLDQSERLVGWTVRDLKTACLEFETLDLIYLI